MIDFIRFSRVLNCQLQSTRWSRFFGSVDQGYVSMVAKRLLLWIFRSGRLRAVWILSSSPRGTREFKPLVFRLCLLQAPEFIRGAVDLVLRTICATRTTKLLVLSAIAFVGMRYTWSTKRNTHRRYEALWERLYTDSPKTEE